MGKKTEITFYSDASHNYMVLECPPQICDNYQYKMLAANQIRGLLSCSSRTIDSREYLYYDISSRQSLTDLYDRRPVRGTDLQSLLESLVLTEETLTEYLLDAAHLILDPACIYVDFSEQSYSFTYYPGEEQEKGWETLFTYLADRVEGRDKEAAALIYRLCMMAEHPGFRLRAEVLQELGVRIPHVGRERQSPGSAPGSDWMMTGLLPEKDRTLNSTGGGTQMYGKRRDALQGPPLSPGGTYNADDSDSSSAWACQENLYGMEYDRDGKIPHESRIGGPVSKQAFKKGTGAAIYQRKAGGGKIWIPVLSGLLLIAGIALFLLGRWMFLEERELLLTHALGGIMAAAGIVLSAVWIVRRYRDSRPYRCEDPEKTVRDQRQRDQDQDLFVEELTGDPYTCEYDAGSAGTKSRAGTPMTGGRGAGSPYASVYLQAPAAETCLLSRNPGMDAGLYGTGNYRGEQIDLTNLPCVVGKIQEYVDQVLNDSSVSRMHARFSLDQAGRMTVRDLNSTNGTWLNGERLQPNESRMMEPGDHLRLGRMEFVFR